MPSTAIHCHPLTSTDNHLVVSSIHWHPLKMTANQFSGSTSRDPLTIPVNTSPLQPHTQQESVLNKFILSSACPHSHLTQKDPFVPSCWHVVYFNKYEQWSALQQVQGGLIPHIFATFARSLSPPVPVHASPPPAAPSTLLTSLKMELHYLHF